MAPVFFGDLASPSSPGVRLRVGEGPVRLCCGDVTGVPSTSANLVLHLDAIDAASLTLLSGGRVSSWADQNGGGIGGVPSLQSLAPDNPLGAPVFNPTGVNGLPGVDFGLSAIPSDSRLRHYGSLSGVSFSPESTNKSYTVICVAETGTLPFDTQDYILFGVGNNANNFSGFNTTRRLEVKGNVSPGPNRTLIDFPVLLPGPGSDGSEGLNPPEPQYVLNQGFIACKTVDAVTGTRFLTIDGSAVKAVTSVNPASLRGSLPDQGAPQITLGGSPTFGTVVNNRSFPGAVGEIRVWDGVLSPSELAAQYTQVAAKWGVTLLP